MPSSDREELISNIMSPSNGDPEYGSIADNNGVATNGAKPPDSRRTLNTFYGVVAPVCLSMFSTLLFLRVGYIVGNAGLLLSLVLLCVAYAILFITVTSIAAISTNGEVEGGGVYFMISRTLGPDFGASVGILFWLANLVGSALFCTGCAEGVADAALRFFDYTLPFESEYLTGLIWSTSLNFLNLFVTLVGGKLFGKLVVGFLCLVMTCYGFVLVSFCSEYEVVEAFNETTIANCTENCTYTTYTGHFSGLANSNLTIWTLAENIAWPSFTRDCEDAEIQVNPATVFAVLFSGVTGIMAGANLSGELKDPSYAIPKGTTISCTLTFVCYALFFVLTGMTCDRTLLQHDCQYMQVFSEFSPIVVVVGIFLTTSCASLSCLLGGSRILESVCKDLMIGPFKTIYNCQRWNNPIGSVLLSWVFVQSFLFLGSLNRISKICSILFLLAYAAVNFSCFVLDWASAPNFRPTSGWFHWSISLVGMIVCLVTSLIIQPVFTLVCWVACAVIYQLFTFAEPATDRNWGSISQAVMFHQVRKYLLCLDPKKNHIKYWRPQVLLLVSNPRRACGIIEFSNALKKGGLFVLGHVVKTDLNNSQSDEDPSLSESANWLSLVDHLKIKAFVELTVSSRLGEGVQHLIRLSGVGAMKPNTVVLGLPFPDEESRDDFADGSKYESEEMSKKFPPMEEVETGYDAVEYLRILEDTYRLRKNFCLFRHFQKLDHGDWFHPGGLLRGSRPRQPMVFFDVWLVDFFAPPSVNFSDTCSEFVLQLAVIVNMVKKWKQLTVRALVRVRERGSAEATELEANLALMLERMRVSARIVLVEFAPPPAVEMPVVANADLNAYDLSTISSEYMEFMNRRVVSLSGSTAISFFYLRKPPFSASADEKKRYLMLLDVVSRGTPPSLFVHGMDNVIATSL